MKQSSHLILCAFVLTINAVSAFPDSVHCDTYGDGTGDPVLRTVVSDRDMKALIVTDDTARFPAGLECPFFLVGSFYRNGLLSVINDPFRCAPDSRIFFERAGFTLKTSGFDAQAPSIAFVPYPDRLTLFLVEESNERKTSGIDVRAPLFSFLSVECVYQATAQEPVTRGGEWFFKERTFQGTTLHNAALKMDIDFPFLAAAVCGGLSGGEMSLPGWFALFQTTVRTDAFSLSFLSRYRSADYFSPLDENGSESLGVGAVIRYSPRPWISMKANGGFRRDTTGPVNGQSNADRIVFGIAASLTCEPVERLALSFDAAYSHAERREPSSIAADNSFDAAVKAEIASRHHLGIEYRFQNQDGETEHVAEISYTAEARFFEVRSRWSEYFSADRQEAAFRLAFKKKGYRVWVEADLSLFNHRPDVDKPFAVSIGLDYSM